MASKQLIEFMMRPKLTLATFLFFYIVITNFSCRKNDPRGPSPSIENPDLLYDFANLESDIVDAGEPLVLQSAITNSMAICPNDCQTETSGLCDRTIRLQYRPDENADWVDAQLEDQNGNVVFEIVKPVPEIPPGMKDTKTEGFSFQTPGFYRYILLSDAFNDINERIENNNDATTEDGDVRASAAKFNLFVKVVDPSGRKLPEFDSSIPIIVKYLGE
jgi:hypothetical protein